MGGCIFHTLIYDGIVRQSFCALVVSEGGVLLCVIVPQPPGQHVWLLAAGVAALPC